MFPKPPPFNRFVLHTPPGKPFPTEEWSPPSAMQPLNLDSPSFRFRSKKRKKKSVIRRRRSKKTRRRRSKISRKFRVRGRQPKSLRYLAAEMTGVSAVNPDNPLRDLIAEVKQKDPRNFYSNKRTSARRSKGNK